MPAASVRDGGRETATVAGMTANATSSPSDRNPFHPARGLPRGPEAQNRPRNGRRQDRWRVIGKRKLSDGKLDSL